MKGGQFPDCASTGLAASAPLGRLAVPPLHVAVYCLLGALGSGRLRSVSEPNP